MGQKHGWTDDRWTDGQIDRRPDALSSCPPVLLSSCPPVPLSSMQRSQPKANMAKKEEQGRRRGSAGKVVSSAKRSGPGRGFWMLAAAVVVIGAGTLYYQATQPKVTARTIDPNLPKLKAEGYVMGSPSAPVE